MPFLTPSSAVRLRRAAALAVLLASGGALPAAEAVVNAFAGSETLVICRSSFVPRAGEEVWFRVVRDHRTVAAGTVRAGGDGRIALPVALPGIRPGVALPLEVTLRAGSEQGRVLPGGGTLWALAEQPLPPGRNPAAPRAIRLYDPVGRTEAAFRSISLPFESVVRLAALAAMTNTTLVVGEVEVLQCVAKGRSRKQIADALYISPFTVHTHLKNIYVKLDAHNHIEAINAARSLGVIA